MRPCTWVHPWLPALGSAMTPLWAPIRHKLTHALAAWHPSDASALALLSPWQPVFDAKAGLIHLHSQGILSLQRHSITVQTLVC